jgi:predicted TIM-barrel fold metal-dependent hydrolase
MEPTMNKTIAVFVNDADQAQAWLAPMLKQHAGARWVLVACAPRLTRRIGKFAAHANRQQWRREWCDRLFARLAPLFECAPQTLVADAALQDVVQRLKRQHGEGLQLLDARRPRLGAEQEPLVPTLVPANRWAVPVAVSSGLSVMLALAD